ncbi:MAG: YndJ family transporter [Saprospiraceae bacterium]
MLCERKTSPIAQLFSIQIFSNSYVCCPMPILSKYPISPIFLWVVIVVLAGSDFRQNQWECLLVMFAALELVPKGLQLLGLPQKDWYALTATGFCAAYLSEGFWFVALPYLLWAAWLTLREATEVFFLKKSQLADFVRVFALGYWATGAAFALLYLADISPLGFDAVIVSLTAAHFHVAGFVLAVLVFCMIRERPSATNRALGWVSLAGMPLVAAGITSAQLGFPTVLEQASALAFVVFALAVIAQQIGLFFQPKYSKTARWLWLAGAGCLLAGSILAGLYALRFQIPIEWVSIPNMKIWHGTLNTFGFAWLSLLAWSNSARHENQSN